MEKWLQAHYWSLFQASLWLSSTNFIKMKKPLHFWIYIFFQCLGSWDTQGTGKVSRLCSTSWVLKSWIWIVQNHCDFVTTLIDESHCGTWKGLTYHISLDLLQDIRSGQIFIILTTVLLAFEAILPLVYSWTPLYMDGELFAIFFISETGRDIKKII